MKTQQPSSPGLSRSRGPRDRGAVLVIVMLVILGLLGLGVTALWLTTGNLQVGANMNLRAQALYVAEAGIERAREILNGPVPPNVNALLAGSTPGLDNVPTSVDAAGRPNGIGAVLVDTAGVPLSNVAYPPATFGRTAGTANAPTATTMGTYTVWIRNDASELRQGLYTSDTNLAVVVRSRGLAPDGRTNVTLEVTLGPSPSNPGAPGNPALTPPVLCNSGKNACDDNNSTQYGIVVN